MYFNSADIRENSELATRWVGNCEKKLDFFKQKSGNLQFLRFFSCFFSVDMVLSVLLRQCFIAVTLYIFRIKSVLEVMKGGRTEERVFLVGILS